MKTPSWAVTFLRESRVAHLATATMDGTPHVIPVCFILDGSRIYTSIDDKPKRVEPRRLRRVLNVKTNPKVSLVADLYSEDWRGLQFVLITGKARLLHSGPEHKRAVILLRKKYKQYHRMKIEQRPIIRITVLKLTAWTSRRHPR